MIETAEFRAAQHCLTLEKAAEALASALDEVGTDVARQHATEVRGAARMAEGWRWQLMELDRDKTARKP